MLTVLEAIGIVAFAFAGAANAVRSRLDIFGVVVSATVTAIGGGVMRDVLLGIHPPVGLLTGWYFIACTCTAVLVFCFYPQLAGLKLTVQVADAIGLAMFAVTGASRAVEHGVGWYGAAMIGTVNAVGGGMVMETLIGRTPTVLRRDIYAIPALVGGLLVAIGSAVGAPATPLTLAVVALVVAARVLAVKLSWNLPVGRPHRRAAAESDICEIRTDQLAESTGVLTDGASELDQPAPNREHAAAGGRARQ